MRFLTAVLTAMTLMFVTLPAASEPFETLESELSKLGVASHHLGRIVNSNTLRAARKMCLLIAHHALKENGIKPIQFSEIAAHCAHGNLHKALTIMGGTVADDIIHSAHVITGGAIRHVHKWEHEASGAWHKIK
tara:strand:+ start:204 stop:605 length:402 start_codon:yes stop_codon:yes gene_type:complete